MTPVDTVYVRFMREVVSDRGTEGYEKLYAKYIPVWSIPRQGEWATITILGLERDVEVVKVVFKYKDDAGFSDAKVSSIEIIVR